MWLSCTLAAATKLNRNLMMSPPELLERRSSVRREALEAIGGNHG